MNLAALPSDVIIILMHSLLARDLAVLSCTCRTLHDLVSRELHSMSASVDQS